MNIKTDLETIIEILQISKEDLANDLKMSRQTIYRLLDNNYQPSNRTIDAIYNYAFKKHILLNTMQESFLKEENEYDDQLVLFHGAKSKIDGEIDLNHSKEKNDFGNGFYLGESFEQAATYISATFSNNVYAFKIDKKDLKIINFNVSEEWLLAIAYYRGWIDIYKDNKRIKEIIEKVDNCDLLIAPIADNKMFEIINEFTMGYINEQQCIHALAATNLGMQYVIKSKKALDKLVLLNEMFVSTSELEDLNRKRIELRSNNLDKVKAARIKYKNSGDYIEDILK
jgi:transcriptional regulator with XRE-family HTH domain